MILEGILTTLNEDRSANVSPMGPIVNAAITEMVLRPYQTSRTYQNLKRHGEGVFHVTDNVEMLTQAAIGRLESPPELREAEKVQGWILADACRWYAFRVVHLDDRRERTTIHCEVVETGRQRDFFGFNRAKHAVLEAAILATRVELLSQEQIQAEFQRLAVIIEKTAGDQERRAFEMLNAFLIEAWKQPGQEGIDWWTSP